MMNEGMEQFEQRLSHLPLRRVPAEWREDILATAKRHQPSSAGRTYFLSALRSQLSGLFWPHHVAGAGLAAIWILILTLDFSIRDKTSVIAEKTTPPSAGVIVQLLQQQRLLAELMGPRDPHPADRSKHLAPEHRSECVEFQMA